MVHLSKKKILCVSEGEMEETATNGATKSYKCDPGLQSET